MNVLVIGSGAREHVLIWKLKQNPEVKKIYCSPGNGGIGSITTLIPSFAESDWNSYADFAKQEAIDLTVVCPEKPLANGIADCFQEKGLRIFGPNKKCVQLESSKIFAKQFMKKHGIPTTNFHMFDNPAKAIDFVSHLHPPAHYHFPLVIKAEGLTAGKGGYICHTVEEAISVIEKIMVDKIFGTAGEKIFIEEKIDGKELSIMALCDGKTLKILPFARTYKRFFDNDPCPHTGGMSAMSPATVPNKTLKEIDKLILQPFIKGIRSENLDYRGVIYFGLMLTDKHPYVLELKVRFGDPETQVVLPLIQTDLLSLFNAVIDGNLRKVSLKVENAFCFGIVCASPTCPGKFKNGKEISGLDDIDTTDENSFVFHAGTSKKDDKYYTHGGRVLTVVAKGKSPNEARIKSHDIVSKIHFGKMHFRNDIAK